MQRAGRVSGLRYDESVWVTARTRRLCNHGARRSARRRGHPQYRNDLAWLWHRRLQFHNATQTGDQAGSRIARCRRLRRSHRNYRWGQDDRHYEFARDFASLIGVAHAEDPIGPWREHEVPFSPRKDSWDNWHLSTGPMLTDRPDCPIMFYNGATQDARWRIGWIAFNADCTAVADRCIEPLIIPPSSFNRLNADIAFAASVLVDTSGIILYYSLADRALRRAVIGRRIG